MDQQTRELINCAKFNKHHLKGSTLIVNINGGTYAVHISGIGSKAIRCSLFVEFDDIIRYKNHRRLENMLYEKITKVYSNKKGGSVWKAL